MNDSVFSRPTPTLLHSSFLPKLAQVGHHKNLAYARRWRGAGGRGGYVTGLKDRGVRRRHVRAVPSTEQEAHAHAGVRYSGGVRRMAASGRGEHLSSGTYLAPTFSAGNTSLEEGIPAA